MIALQLAVIFAFGLVITGLVFVGMLRAREVETRAAKARVFEFRAGQSRRNAA